LSYTAIIEDSEHLISAVLEDLTKNGSKSKEARVSKKLLLRRKRRERTCGDLGEGVTSCFQTSLLLVYRKSDQYHEQRMGGSGD